jgi:hypothetical protein
VGGEGWWGTSEVKKGVVRDKEAQVDSREK